MDVREVLLTARGQAGLDQRRLALKAGTARTTVVAYETGTRSPTVRQLTRLLAACGLQARVVLEPLTAEVDAVLDAAVSGDPPPAIDDVSKFARAWAAAGVTWALDGASAVCAQGLALPHAALAVVLVADDVGRRWLRDQGTVAWDRYGFTLAPNWGEEPEKLEEYTRTPVHSRFGFLQIRLVEALPQPVLAVQIDGEMHPVLPLTEIRRAHPGLAELLRRHEERQGAG